jgi:mRNA-degrading endonuclease RelE of RelBE toxin-antitoxin system
VYRITYATGVANDLKTLRATERALILDRIELQLRHEPTRPTRNRKILVDLVPPWKHIPPVWELRVGEHRVFYDVDETSATVMVRAIRRKPAHKTTEEIV